MHPLYLLFSDIFIALLSPSLVSVEHVIVLSNFLDSDIEIGGFTLILFDSLTFDILVHHLDLLVERALLVTLRS